MKRPLTFFVGLSLALVLGACSEQPLDPDVATAAGGDPGPPAGTPVPPDAGPPPGTPIPPGAGPPPVSTYAVGAGSGFSCALRNGLAFCWGRGGGGRLGNGGFTDSPSPVAVLGGRRYESLAVGDGHTCALGSDGTAYCWGRNNVGQLGNGTTANSPEPVAVSGGLSFMTLAAGMRHTCGITAEGAAYCWGRNNWRQLGDGSSTDSSVPVAVDTNVAFASISADFYKSCALAADGNAYCWGLAIDDFGNGGGVAVYPTPVQAATGFSLSSIHAGLRHACGVELTGAALCWGRDQFGTGTGKLGLGTSGGTVPTPSPVVGGLTFTTLDVMNDNNILGHTCGVTTAGDAYCWGSNSGGALGGLSTDACEFDDVPFDCSGSPVLVQGGITFRQVAVGSGSGSAPFKEHTCGLAEDGSVYCWGGNEFGQLGDGTLADRPAPVLVNLP